MKNDNRNKIVIQDRIRGCLYGGAVGDALGYPIEFLGEKEIIHRYGTGGIQEYVMDLESRKALISDDTQMTLFTADGLLSWTKEIKERKVESTLSQYLYDFYQEWLLTQEISFSKRENVQQGDRRYVSRLMEIPELYQSRVPGNTCLSALSHQRKSGVRGRVDVPLNTSKGAGGIMRIAPAALCNYLDLEFMEREGAEIAAITHSHSLGYIPAAVMVHIINRIVYPKQQTLKEIVIEAKESAKKLFEGDKNLKQLTDIMDLAVLLSENTDTDLANINRIGEGWVAEEALGIALYCSLRHQDDFSAGIIASVNHKGDSDTTGAVTGNILGALTGYAEIEDKWKQNLELSDTILKMADEIAAIDE